MPSSGEMGGKKYSLDTVILVGNLMELLRVFSYARLKAVRNLYIRKHRVVCFEQSDN